ncbi:MAG: hypothetical protein ABI439_05720 [Rhodospirillales bacterium]
MSANLKLISALGLAASFATAALADDKLPIGRYADFALSSTETTLTDIDDLVVRRWTDNSGENIARLVSVDRAQKLAVVTLDSARMTLKIPLGWYAIDDGERGAVFTPDEMVRVVARQVDLTLEGTKTIAEYAQIKRGLLIQRFPQSEAIEQKLGAGIIMNIYRHVPARPNDNGPREIYEIITADPKDSNRAQLTTLGVPDGQGARYLPLLGLIIQDRVLNW